MIPIYRPFFTEDNLRPAHDAISSTWVSSLGEYKDKAVEELKKVTKSEHVVLTSSGTAAMHLVAHALTFNRPNIRRLIVPNNVYVAAWNAFIYGPTYELVPIDADLNTWNVDLDLLRNELKKSDNDTAVLIVHNLGNPIDVTKLRREFPRTAFVEDNCEGLFGTYSGQPTGSASLASGISFYGNKTITAGEGGATTTDRRTYEHLNMVHTQGTGPLRYIHEILGYNYRMTNVAAAVLYGQLQSLDFILQEKKRIFNIYRREFRAQNVSLQLIDWDCTHANWMFGLRLVGRDFSDFAKQVTEFEVRPMFAPMSAHRHLATFAEPHLERNAAILRKEVVILPSFPGLTDIELETIINGVHRFLRSSR